MNVSNGTLGRSWSWSRSRSWSQAKRVLRNSTSQRKYGLGNGIAKDKHTSGAHHRDAIRGEGDSGIGARVVEHDGTHPAVLRRGAELCPGGEAGRKVLRVLGEADGVEQDDEQRLQPVGGLCRGDDAGQDGQSDGVLGRFLRILAQLGRHRAAVDGATGIRDVAGLAGGSLVGAWM